MKFAFVSTMASVPWGGSELLWSEAAEQLAIMGHQVYASLPQWPQSPQKVRELRDEIGVRIWERPQYPSLLKRGLKRLLGTTRKVDILNPERHWLKHLKPDLVCISSGNATEGLPWMAIAESLNIPYTFIAQAHTEFLWPLDQQLELFRYLFDQAEKCFFVSHGNLKLLETQIAHRLINSEVVYNPFNVSWDFQYPWPDVSSGTWNLACVGRLHPPSKGQDLILEVLNSEKWKARPIKLSFFGKGEHKEGLARLAKNYGLVNIVDFRGHVAEVEEIWCNHHALVLPSRYEGLPLAIVEAMICKRPVITTNVAGNAEFIDDGVTGFIAEAPTSLHLDQAMERAWDAREQWQDMGIRSQQMIRQNVPEKPGLEFAKKLEDIAKNLTRRNTISA